MTKPQSVQKPQIKLRTVLPLIAVATPAAQTRYTTFYTLDLMKYIDIEYYFLPGGFKKDAIQDLRTLSIQEQGANTNNYTQMCSSDEDECCVSPLLDSSPEITRAGDREDSDGDHDDHELCDKRQQDTDSDTGLVKFGDLF